MLDLFPLSQHGYTLGQTRVYGGAAPGANGGNDIRYIVLFCQGGQLQLYLILTVKGNHP